MFGQISREVRYIPFDPQMTMANLSHFEVVPPMRTEPQARGFLGNSPKPKGSVTRLLSGPRMKRKLESESKPGEVKVGQGKPQ